MLQPLGNVLAVWEASPQARQNVRRELASDGEFDEISQTASGWVVALRTLPGPDASHLELREGLLAMEGADLFATEDLLDDLTQRLDRNLSGLQGLPGDFTLLHLKENGGAVLVRSCGGLVPLYYYSDPSKGRRVISTRTRYVARLVHPKLDPLVNAVWATGWTYFPDNRGFLEGVRIVPRGHALAFQPDGTQRLVGYWHPTVANLTRPTRDEIEEHISRFRSLLLENLDRDLDRSGQNLLTLSGGVDSSSLGALASGLLRRPLSHLSLIPPDDYGRESVLHYIRQVADDFDLNHRIEYTVDLTRYHELRLMAPPAGIPVIHPALCLLPHCVERDKFTVLVGGEFADDIAGGHVAVPDWLAATSFPRLVRRLRHLPHGPSDLARWGVWRWRWLRSDPAWAAPRTLPAIFRRDIREQWSEWRERTHRELPTHKEPKHSLALASLHDGWVTMNWEAASEMDMRRSIPFFTREMLELAWSCHPDELVGPGTKLLLRRALRGLVPDGYLDRPARSAWQRQPVDGTQVAWTYELHPDVRELLDEDLRPGELDWNAATVVAPLQAASLALDAESR